MMRRVVCLLAFALMTLPTMLSGFVLAPKVMREAKRYFGKLKTEERR